jgi:DNA processing protein
VTPEPESCDACLRRAWLLGDLSGHLETAVADARGRRAAELLALPDQRLVGALAGEAPSILARSFARRPARLRSEVAAAGLWSCCRHGRGFPAALEHDPQAPAALFGRGDPALLARLGAPEDAVTVVGARRPSAYGRELAESLGRELGAAGLAVVSGMALGVDSRAHSGALLSGGLTVAVLGSGADLPYPASLRRLYESIVSSGLVLSELPPGTAARRWSFPARNRIMAALAAMTVVVEARERSGSLITATMAAELGREVGAVPGRVGNATAAGANALLRDGAQVVRDAQDVLDSLLGAGALPAGAGAGRAGGPELDAELATVLSLVEAGAGAADAVAVEGGIPPARAAAALARLELLGYLRGGSGSGLERTALRAPEPD